MPILSALGRWMRGDQKLGSSWTTRNPAAKTHQTNRKTEKQTSYSNRKMGTPASASGIKPAWCHAFHVTTLLPAFSPLGQLSRALTHPLEHRPIGHRLTGSLTMRLLPEVSVGTGGVRTPSSATSERTTPGRSKSHGAQRGEEGEVAGGTGTNKLVWEGGRGARQKAGEV